MPGPPPRPAAGVPIRERLLEAAEHEFARHGYRGASLRRLTEAAGVALGNVGHIFGGKRQLFEETFARIYEPVLAARMSNLDALLARDPAPSVEALFDAYEDPIVGLLCREGGETHAMFAMRAVLEHEAYWPLVKDFMQRQGDGYPRAVAAAMAELPAEEALRRWTAAARHFFFSLNPYVHNVETPTAPDAADILRVRRESQSLPRLAAAEENLEEYPYSYRPGVDA